jgi:hypothetical protein
MLRRRYIAGWHQACNPCAATQVHGDINSAGVRGHGADASVLYDFWSGDGGIDSSGNGHGSLRDRRAANQAVGTPYSTGSHHHGASSVFAVRHRQRSPTLSATLAALTPSPTGTASAGGTALPALQPIPTVLTERTPGSSPVSGAVSVSMTVQATSAALPPWPQDGPLSSRRDAVSALLRSDFSPLRLPVAEAPLLFVDAVKRFCTFDPSAELSFTGTTDSVCQLATSIISAYRPNPYHNWRHAMGAVHCTVMLLERSSASWRTLSQLDRLAALLAALAHDVDHRGRTNAFESNSLSDLALRYNVDAVLEHHHAAFFCRCGEGGGSDTLLRGSVHGHFTTIVAFMHSVSNIWPCFLLNAQLASQLGQFFVVVPVALRVFRVVMSRAPSCDAKVR